VHLRGTIKNSTNATLFKLSPGYSSSGQLFFLLVSNFNAVVLRVLADGTVFLGGGYSNILTSIDGVSFRGEL